MYSTSQNKKKVYAHEGCILKIDQKNVHFWFFGISCMASGDDEVTSESALVNVTLPIRTVPV